MLPIKAKREARDGEKLRLWLDEVIKRMPTARFLAHFCFIRTRWMAALHVLNMNP
jgi:hypothetical protein